MHWICSITVGLSPQELIIDGGSGGGYGEAVAIYENRIFVSATESNEVYLFTTKETGTGWSEQQVITADNTNIGDKFGESIAVSADYLVIGASSAGSAYVFIEPAAAPGNYTQLTQLIPSISAYDNDSRCGETVDVSGETVILGCPGYNSNAGAAVMFALEGTDSWHETQVLYGRGVSGDKFGQSTALQNGTAVIGCDFGKYIQVLNRESNDTWQQVQEIASSTSRFGSAISFYDDVLAVGAPEEDIVYMYTFDGAKWQYTQAPPNWLCNGSNCQFTGSYFGSSLALYSDSLLVGAPRAGSVFLFARSDNWRWEETWTSPSPDRDLGSTNQVAIWAGVCVASGFDEAFAYSLIQTAAPTRAPTHGPSRAPSNIPTTNPTVEPSFAPTRTPMQDPSMEATLLPSIDPTLNPSTVQTVELTANSAENEKEVAVDPITTHNSVPTDASLDGGDGEDESKADEGNLMLTVVIVLGTALIAIFVTSVCAIGCRCTSNIRARVKTKVVGESEKHKIEMNAPACALNTNSPIETLGGVETLELADVAKDHPIIDDVDPVTSGYLREMHTDEEDIVDGEDGDVVTDGQDFVVETKN